MHWQVCSYPDQWVRQVHSVAAFQAFNGFWLPEWILAVPIHCLAFDVCLSSSVSHALAQSYQYLFVNPMRVQQPFQRAVTHSLTPDFCILTGTLFWMWGFCPENTQENNLQVAAGDADFGAVIAPSALSAALRAAAESPISECIKVSIF